MFRIHFDAASAMWLVQFQKFGFLWFTVKMVCENPTGSDVVIDRRFDTFDNAMYWCEQKGITTTYKRMADPISEPSWGYTQ